MMQKKRGKRERGQSFMELAISLLFLLILLSVVIDLGWAFYLMISLRDTVQEAATYGIMCPDENLIRARLIASTNAPLNAADITIDSVEFINPLTGDPADGKHGDILKISATVNHKILVPFAGTFIGRYEYPLQVDVSDTVMVDECPVP